MSPAEPCSRSTGPGRRVFKRTMNVLRSRRKVLLVTVGGAACLCILVLLGLPGLRQDGDLRAGPSSRMINPALGSDAGPNRPQDAPLVLSPEIASKAIASKSSGREAGHWPSPPVPDRAAGEFHARFAADLRARLEAQTLGLYGRVFQKLHLAEGVQKEVIGVLTQQQRQMEEQAFAAAQGGTFPAPPSMETERAQQVQEDQRLRSLLGGADFAAFDRYRAMLPDLTAIDSMNQQGANLNESQSQQLLQVLTEARQQVMNQSGIRTRNLDSMPPEQAMALIEQQQALLLQTVRDRTQNVLRPEQSALLEGILSPPFSGGPSASR
jgi:hypothetical protein